MGLFGKKETCCICNQNDGKKKILDGVVCDACYSNCVYYIPVFNLKSKTSEQIRQAMSANEHNTELANVYRSTNKIEKYLDVDENNRLWGSPCFSTHFFFSYDDIISFELLENGNSVTKGGLGSAVVGGALFGGVGAIVGAGAGKKKGRREITEFRIKIITRNQFIPEVYINFLTAGKVMSDSFLYKSYVNSAQSVLSALTIMTDKATSGENVSAADEILKYKNLLDQGILTQEEFEIKKKQLLGI